MLRGLCPVSKLQQQGIGLLEMDAKTCLQPLKVVAHQSVVSYCLLAPVLKLFDCNVQ